MTTITRRAVLVRMVRGLLGSFVAGSIVACGRNADSPTTAPSAMMLPAVGNSEMSNSTVTRSTVAPLATPTSYPASSDCWSTVSERPFGATPRPEDPYIGGLATEGAAIAFADRVLQADLVVLIEQPTTLPARWTTADGKRPADPHHYAATIITPERAKIVTVAKGKYDLPDLYLEHYGGRIRQDCVFLSDSLSLGGGAPGMQAIYLAELKDRNVIVPLKGDPRY